jgi:hypothetical protein
MQAGAFAADVKDYANGPTPWNARSYSDDKGTFTISIPANWTPEPKGGILVFSLPDKSGNLRIEVLVAQGLNFESILDDARAEMKKNIKDNKFLSDARAKFGSLEARHWVFEMQPKGFTVRLGQFMFLKGGRLFAITYGCRAEKWEKHSRECEQILASLKLK